MPFKFILTKSTGFYKAVSSDQPTVLFDAINTILDYMKFSIIDVTIFVTLVNFFLSLKPKQRAKIRHVVFYFDLNHVAIKLAVRNILYSVDLKIEDENIIDIFMKRNITEDEMYIKIRSYVGEE